jgi:hypothetical protein
VYGVDSDLVDFLNGPLATQTATTTVGPRSPKSGPSLTNWLPATKCTTPELQMCYDSPMNTRNTTSAAHAPRKKDQLEENVACDICNAQFRGRYRLGNRARHVRQSHRSIDGTDMESQYPCQLDGCFRVFRRPDARRKHMHRHHTHQSAMLLGLSSNDSNSNHKSGLQADLASNVVGMQNPSTTYEKSRSVIQALRTELDDHAYTRLCDTFIGRWEEVIEELRTSK